MVDQTIATHCTAEIHRSTAGERSWARMRCIQHKLNTAEATCSEGQALPAASTPLTTARPGYRLQSMWTSGVWVGNHQKSARQNRHMAPTQTPNHTRARRLPITAGGRNTYNQSDT